MLDRFICPDGNEVPVDRCLSECRLQSKLECGRCLSYRMLSSIARQRPWNGTPTVTQLLNGTREEFLKLTTSYAASPQSKVAAFFGSTCHAAIEAHSDAHRMICEQRLTDPTGTYSGQFDCYDRQDAILYDTKTYGSYKAAQVLGVEKIKEPVVDPLTGEVELTRTGRVRYSSRIAQGRRRMLDATIQLNAYRLMLEAQGFPVKRMILEVIVRDGGTWIALDRGVSNNAMLVPVHRISDGWIQRYMLAKAHSLIDAIERRKLPPPCRPRECWYGRKCKGFCSVSQFCDRGR